MKFVHIADMHFDSPFISLSDKDIMGDLRRLEQRKVFKKVIQYIQDNKIEYLFISGDLYESQYVKQSTIEYINSLFQQIPNTKIFISPGNHDPFIRNSYYNKYNWNENVKIFNSQIEKIETEDADIYGFGFNDFYCTDCGIEEFEIENRNKINILIMHGTVDGASIEEKQYNSLSKNILKSKGFDYVALGHIHKINYKTEKNQNIVYPGSTISLGFDELGEHGMIVGDIQKEFVDMQFIPLDDEEFKEIYIDVSDLFSKEDLIEKINDIEIKSNEYIKIILKGNRNFEINRYEILKYILNDRIIKVKDFTKIAYDLEKIENERTLKGLFAKEMRDLLESQEITQEDKKIIEKAVEIGFEALG